MRPTTGCTESRKVGLSTATMATGAFCPFTFSAANNYKVDYVVGLAKNDRLLALVEKPMQQAAVAFEATKEKQRHFVRLEYAAKSWDRPRTVIAKAEHTEKGANPRFILTSLEGESQNIYDKIYCARGEMEPTEGR